MTAVNQIDYEKLANMAREENVPFERLCRNAERGLPMRTLKPTTEDWIDYKGVSEILHCSYGTLSSHFTNNNRGLRELEYWGIEWKTRSLNDGVSEGKRGCGVLFKRTDISKVMRIRKVAGLGILAALRVFQAQRKGLL